MDPAAGDVVIRPRFGVVLQHVPITLVSPLIGWSWDPEERRPSHHRGPSCQGCQEKFSCANKYHQSRSTLKTYLFHHASISAAHSSSSSSKSSMIAS